MYCILGIIIWCAYVSEDYNFDHLILGVMWIDRGLFSDFCRRTTGCTRLLWNKSWSQEFEGGVQKEYKVVQKYKTGREFKLLWQTFIPCLWQLTHPGWGIFSQLSRISDFGECGSQCVWIWGCGWGERELGGVPSSEVQDGLNGPLTLRSWPRRGTVWGGSDSSSTLETKAELCRPQQWCIFPPKTPHYHFREDVSRTNQWLSAVVTYESHSFCLYILRSCLNYD